jgi:hypothetical protein
MTEQQWQSLERAIGQMSEPEKLELIDRVARTMQAAGRNGKPDPEAARRLLEEVSAMPVQGPNDGFSGADHDRILYGWDKK